MIGYFNDNSGKPMYTSLTYLFENAMRTLSGSVKYPSDTLKMQRLYKWCLRKIHMKVVCKQKRCNNVFATATTVYMILKHE